MKENAEEMGAKRAGKTAEQWSKKSGGTVGLSSSQSSFPVWTGWEGGVCRGIPAVWLPQSWQPHT